MESRESRFPCVTMATSGFYIEAASEVKRKINCFNTHVDINTDSQPIAHHEVDSNMERYDSFYTVAEEVRTEGRLESSDQGLVVHSSNTVATHRTIPVVVIHVKKLLLKESKKSYRLTIWELITYSTR